MVVQQELLAVFEEKLVRPAPHVEPEGARVLLERDERFGPVVADRGEARPAGVRLVR